MSRGRPALAVGELGSIAYTVSGSRVSATAWTRDASGERRKLRATAPSMDDAAALLRNKAAQLALTDGLAGSDSTFRDLLDTWCADVVSLRNIREQTKRMYYVSLKRERSATPILALAPRSLWRDERGPLELPWERIIPASSSARSATA